MVTNPKFMWRWDHCYLVKLQVCFLSVYKYYVWKSNHSVYGLSELKPRLCARALLLCILATVRGVYVVIENPSGSAMRWYPDLVGTGELIRKYLGANSWFEQFLLGSQMSQFCLTTSHV